MADTSTRFYFDTYQAAAAGLLAVLLDARVTKKTYRFGGLTTTTVFTSGLWLEGDIEEVSKKIEALPGALRQED